MAEKEYIEREALLKKLEELLSDLSFIVNYEKKHGSLSDVEKSKARFEEMKGVINLVKSQPIAEVQGVRYGKPVQMLNDVISEKAITVCSCCNGKISKNDTWCKHCGAKNG